MSFHHRHGINVGRFLAFRSGFLRLALLFAAAFGASLACAPAGAATYTFDAGGLNGNGGTPADGSDVWSTSSANWWTGLGAGDTEWTTSADSAYFGATAGSNPYTVTLGSNIATAGITFASQNYTIAGSGLYGLSIGSGGIAASAPAAISAPITLLAPQQWTNNSSGPLTISGSVAGGSNLLTIAGSGATTLSGVLGSGAGGLTMAGTGGILTLSGTSNSTGTTTIGSGITVLANNAALGSGPVSLAGGTLRLAVAPPAAGTGSIGVNFEGSGPVLVTGSDGVVPMTGWNNLPNSYYSGTTSALNNNSGVATTTTLTLTGANHGAGGSGSSDQLLNGYIYVNASQQSSGTISAMFNNIPYGNYSLYAYISDSSTTYEQKLTINGTPYYFTTTNSSSFLQITSTSSSSFPTGNYVVATGLTGGSQAVSDFGLNTVYGAFAGFEIVNTTPGGLPNAVTLTSNSTIDVSGASSRGVFTGLFTTGGNQLSVTGSGTGLGTPYSLSLGAVGGVSLTGNPIFNVANNGGAAGTLILGALSDGGVARTITISNSGAVTLGTAASSITANDTVNITGGTLNLNNATALGTTTTINVANGATLSLGANPTIAALGDNGTVAVNGASVLLNANSLTIGNGSNLSSTFSGVISNGTGGSGSIVKAGNGMLALAGANTYTGSTTLTAGTLQIQGNSLPAASPVSLGSATLQILNDGTQSGGTIGVGSNITLSTGTSTDYINVGDLISSNTGNTVAFGVLSNGTSANGLNSSINFTGANGYVQSFTGLRLTGSTGYNTTLNPTTASVIITGGVANQMTGFGSGNYDTLTLAGSSTGNAIAGAISDATNYVAVNDGDTRLTVSTTGGAWTLNGANTFHGPINITSGTLTIGGTGYLGGGNYGGTTGSTFTNNGAFVMSTSSNQVFNGAISGSGAFYQMGSGSTTLAASNSYTGGTIIGGGTLALGSAGYISQSPTISLGNGANFDVSAQGSNYHLVSGQTLTGIGNYTVNGAMTANSGSTILPGGVSSSGTLNVGALTLSTGSVLKYDLGSGQDLIDVGYSSGLNVTGGSIDLYQSNGTSQFSTLGTYTLMSYFGAVSGAPSNLSVLNGVPGDSYVFAATSGSLTVTISNGDIWTGGAGSPFNWSSSANWSTNQPPSSGVPVAFSGSVGLSNINNLSNLNLASLSFTSSAGAFNLSGNSIQLSGAITNSSTATQTIGLNIGLAGGSQTINAAAGNIVLNGVISDGGAGLGISVSGSGTVTLAASNTYGGGTVLSAGVLQAANNSSLGSGPIALNGGALTSTGTGGLAFANAFSLGGNATLGDPVNNGPLTFSGSGTIAVANPQLAVNSPVTFSGAIGDGGNGWTLLGPSLLGLTGSNAITGTTTVSGGTLQLNTSGASALNGNLAVSGGTVQLLQSNQIASTANVSVSSGLLSISGNSNSVNGLQVTGGTIAGTSGVLSSATDYDAQNGVVSAILGGSVNLNKTTSGTVVLAAANTYSGSTSVTAGTLTLAHPLAVQNSTVSVGAAGALSFAQGITSPTLGGLAGAGNIALATAASEPVALNVGSNGQSTIYSGTLSGPGSLVKQGTGTLSLAAAQSYSGPTLITGGMLQLLPASSTSIGVNFEGGNPTLVNGTDGVVPMSNWNNLPNTANNVTNYALNNNNNALTTATLTTTGANHAVGNTLNYSDELLNGYIYVNASQQSSGTISAIFNNIPYSNYSLYAYISDSTPYDEEATINGTPYYFTATNSSSFLQITSTSSSSFPTGNYVVATGLTGSSQAVSDFGLNTVYGAFAGFEIVNTAPSAGASLPATTPVTISNGGTLNMTNLTQTIFSLSSTDGMGSQVLLGNGALTIAGTAVTTFDGVISDGGAGGSLVLQGGMLTLTGSNTYFGGTTVSGGTLQVGAGGSGASIGMTSGVTLGGAAIIFNHADNMALAAAITGSGSLTQTGSGVLTLQNSANSYTGGTTINGGGIQLGGLDGQIPSLASSAAGGLGGALTIASGTLDLNGQAQTVGALNGSASALITDTQSGGGGPGSNGTTPLTIDFDSGSSNYGGTIADGPTAFISLTKEGAGTLILSGTNTYSGGTIVSEGTLQLNDSQALAGGSSLTVGDALAFGAVLPAAAPAITAVPEPSTLVLLAFGLWTAAIYRRFSKRRNRKLL